MTLEVHPVSVDDAERMVEAMDPGTTKNLRFFSEPVSIERQRAYLTEVIENHAVDVRCIEDDGVLVGTIGLHEIDLRLRTARLGLLIFRPEDRGKGYGKAAIMIMLSVAFEGVRLLNKVYLNVFAENVRSRTFYAKLGFVQEGVLRQEYLLDGKCHDMVRMSMLRSEWAALST